MQEDYNDIQYSLSANNCHIIDGYLTRSREVMEDFCKNVLPARFKAARSVQSYVAEWRAHNLLYDLHLFRSHTKDTDLNIDEKKIARFFYGILSLFYHGK